MDSASPTARRLIQALQLAPLPGEGGFFRPTWRNDTASAILFLLTRADFSALHRLDRDEVWHFYLGHPVEHVQLDPRSGSATMTRMGSGILAGEQPQLVVSAHTWQGARLDPQVDSRDDYALLGCVVSPPWDDAGFRLGDPAELIGEFPGQAALIRALTR